MHNSILPRVGHPHSPKLSNVTCKVEFLRCSCVGIVIVDCDNENIFETLVNGHSWDHLSSIVHPASFPLVYIYLKSQRIDGPETLKGLEIQLRSNQVT